MIYIFDDRFQRRNNNQEKLSKYSDIVKFDTVKTIPGKSVEECVFDAIISPKCIMFHKSYVFEDDNVDFETIRTLFISLDVPIVIFSGGTEGGNKGDSEININADVMYENLPYFLEDFKENEQINIDILLWGKRYKLNAILELQNKLAESFFIKNNLDENIEVIDKVKRTVKHLCEKTNKELGEVIINEIDNSNQLTWGELLCIVDHNLKNLK
ncbi:MAG: hypothetical protein J6B30_05565 [Muribaculaceae bacterium]|nr:hypothetical protein [Muribaculaceae bacterium]